jgi:[protein-PII] uridylyltransferase
MIDYGTLEPAELLAERTARVDRSIGEAAAEVLAAAPAGFALLAVGGYGRGELFPHSDVDLLLLFESESLASECREPISLFLRRLWDCGMRVSQSVRTPGECLEVHDRNTELNISLIDRRFLLGDSGLYQKVESKLPRFLQSQREALIRNLARLTKERHAKYADTFYHLEPNVKETPGGLRDYNLICWLDRLRGIDAERGDALKIAFRHMARIRCWLHDQAGRDQNVLHFDAQEQMAEQWIRRQSEQHDVPDDSAAARWMRGYFRHAREIYRTATTALEEAEAQYSGLFAQFRDWRSRLGNADFSVRRERVQFRESHMVGKDPDLIFRFFEFVARHGIPPSIEATRRVREEAGTLAAYFAQSRPIWPALKRILALPHAPLALRAMHDTGVLTAMFPELRNIECLVVRDFYHRYTVDEHTLVAIEKIWRAEGPFGELLAEATQIGALIFATLFHDAGKGKGGGHVDGSLKLAECAMHRIAMPESDRDAVLFLIRKHLDLSAAMQSRDLADPQTIRELAADIGTVELLKL